LAEGGSASRKAIERAESVVNMVGLGRRLLRAFVREPFRGRRPSGPMFIIGNDAALIMFVAVAGFCS